MIGYFKAIPLELLERLFSEPSDVPRVLHDGATADDELDTDKAWWGIHYLLTGEAWGGEPPLADAVMGGEVIGPDVGYGPARYLTPDAVEAVAKAIAHVTTDQLRRRFADGGLAANDIYPQIWDEGEEALDYLLTYFDALVEFYCRAADRGYAVLLSVS